MLKNLTSSHLLLITIASVVLLLAAFSFLLLQDPSAPLPFSLPPVTNTATPVHTSQPPIMDTDTAVPTLRTSYTPFATLLTPASASPATQVPPTVVLTVNPTQTVLPGGITPSKSPTRTETAIRTPPVVTVSPTSSITPSPTITETLTPGEYGVTGRILQNGTPLANVTVQFEDDVAPRKSGTNQTGHYWFTSLAPRTGFSLTFKQSDNSHLTPPSQIAYLARVEGILTPSGNIIDLPDLDLSINLDDLLFMLVSPADGISYPASVINSSNRLQFIWSPYTQAESYRIELGPYTSQEPIWSSGQITPTNFFWDGTLSDGGHITQGLYWWRVLASRSIGNYVELISAQPWDIQFTP